MDRLLSNTLRQAMALNAEQLDVQFVEVNIPRNVGTTLLVVTSRATGALVYWEVHDLPGFDLHAFMGNLAERLAISTLVIRRRTFRTKRRNLSA